MHPARPLSQVTNANEVSATHELLMEHVAHRVQAEDSPSAAHSLERIRAMLPHHFALEEERDGIFDWIAALTPEQGDTIEFLVSDHASMLSEAEALAALLESSDDASEALAAFAEHIRSHERTESMALQVAMEESDTDAGVR